MARNIYAGNFPLSTTQHDLRALFGAYGEVASVEFITDRHSRQSRGIAFFKMNDQDGNAAMKALDRHMIGDRNIKVNEACPRERTSSNKRGG